MIRHLREHSFFGSEPLRFLVHVRSTRLTNLLGMLRMVGYAPMVIWEQEKNGGLTEIAIEITGSERMEEILRAWLLTIPGVDATTII